MLAVLPSMKSPTMSPLAGGGYAVESVVEKKMINLVIPALKDAGATDLVEMADRQDRPVTELQRASSRTRNGRRPSTSRSAWASIAGADGVDYPFHCIEIADGSRSIDVGADVSFDVLAKLGRWEAANIRP